MSAFHPKRTFKPNVCFRPIADIRAPFHILAMTEGKIVAFSDDRKRRLTVFQRHDGLYVLHDQRLIDPDAVPELEYDLVELTFPEEGQALPPHCFLLDTPLSDALYGNEADAERAAAWLVWV